MTTKDGACRGTRVGAERRTRGRRGRLALGFGAATLALAAPVQAQESYTLEGGSVAIYNLAGRVEVVPGQGRHTVVEVSRGGADRERLAVETGEIDGRETLRVRYPGRRVVYRDLGRSSATVRVRDDGTFFRGWRRGEKVEVSGRGGGLEAHADVTVRVPAGVAVAVHLAAGGVLAADARADLVVETGSGSVEVTDVVGDVHVDTGSGSVSISRVEGDVTADTGSGSVTLNDVAASRLAVDTGSGRIVGEDLRAAGVNVDTGSGAIRLSGLRASDVRCDTGSGSVRLGLLSDVEFLEVDTGSGSIVVEVPRDFGAAVELDTGSGRVEVDVSGRVAETSRRDYFRGRVGDGDGRVVVDTGSGDVTLRQR